MSRYIPRNSCRDSCHHWHVCCFLLHRYFLQSSGHEAYHDGPYLQWDFRCPVPDASLGSWRWFTFFLAVDSSNTRLSWWWSIRYYYWWSYCFGGPQNQLDSKFGLYGGYQRCACIMLVSLHSSLFILLRYRNTARLLDGVAGSSRRTCSSCSSKLTM